MSVRARLIALAVAVALVLATGIVVLVGSRSPGCTVSAPRPSLPAQLRSLGDFDQSYDPTNPPALEDAAQRAASALHSDLIGAIPQPPVFEAAARAGFPGRGGGAAAEPTVIGRREPGCPALVVFLRDCQGAAYFAGVEDDVTAQPPLQGFPPVSQAEAAAQLGGVTPRLVYTTDPLRPRWSTSASPPRSLPAR